MKEAGEMPITVRYAKPEDFPFIAELAGESIVYGVPKIRDIKPEELSAHMKRAYENLSKIYDNQKDIVIFVADDEDQNESVGYLTLILNEVEGSTGERQSFIQDLAVRRRYWGKYVVHKLMDRAAEETKARGLHYITGSISVDNMRAFGTATKALGYELERYQIVRKL
jgi:ribosomal protein S18 acetylase RimI-like enzyme